jgi:hypothetical protein
MGRLLTLLILQLGLLHCSLASAQSTVINYDWRGWYNPAGHSLDNSSYVVGDSRGPSCTPGSGFCFDDYRSYFVFDLGAVTQPIASGKLALYVPDATRPGYSSADPSENFELHDVNTSLSFLNSLTLGSGGVAAWNDLGTGVVYGNRSMTAADMGSIVEVNLNSSAVAAMNAIMQAPTQTHWFAMGGSLTTLDDLPNDEWTFGHTTEFSLYVSELRLTLVPEPSSSLLLVMAGGGLLGCTLRRR